MRLSPVLFFPVSHEIHSVCVSLNLFLTWPPIVMLRSAAVKAAAGQREIMIFFPFSGPALSLLLTQVSFSYYWELWNCSSGRGCWKSRNSGGTETWVACYPKSERAKTLLWFDTGLTPGTHESCSLTLPCHSWGEEWKKLKKASWGR